MDYRFTLYAVAVDAADGTHHRHLLVVPLAHGAVSFNAALALLEAESLTADAGDFAEIARLANAVAWDYRRYRCFPAPPSLGRFTL